MVIDVGRIKHLGDLMHKSIASNGSVVTSNWRLSADGLTNVVWTPDSGGGGSVSYGSNSNEVSYVNAAGASTLVSRTDHVHRGVTSLSHASNTYTGPVTLETEGSLYIVRPADNTYRLGYTLGNHTHAPGGGGVNKALVFGLPTGAFARSYVFTSTVESWTASAGTLSSTGGRLRLVHTSGAVALEPSGASNIANGEIICDFIPVSVTGSAALVFRATDTSNYYMVVFQPASQATLYKCVAGTFSQLSLAPGGTGGPFIPGSLVNHPVRLLVRMNGSSIQAYVNGSLILSMADTVYTTGRVGIRIDNGTMEIDNMDIFNTVDLVTGNVSTP